MKEYGRFIKNSKFLDDMKDNGNLIGLYDYLLSSDNMEGGMEKYNLTIRNNKLTLYNSGRKLDIERREKNYVLSFDFNNADELLKKEEVRLDKIMLELTQKNLFLVANPGTKQEDDILKAYKKWKEFRLAYLFWDQKRKSQNKKNLLKMKFAAVIPHAQLRTYDFKTLLNELHPIFKSYVREEELYRQRCISSLCDFAKDLVIFDVEYSPSFAGIGIENFQSLKKSCCICGSSKKFGKTDLVCLKKEGEFLIPLFVELKVNVNASVQGNQSNILNHLEDNQNYKTLFQYSEREKISFQKYVEQTIRHKLERGFLKIDQKKANVDEIKYILSQIKYEAPELKVVCSLSGVKNETELCLRKKMQEKFGKKLESFDNEIIVMEDVLYLENLNWADRKGASINSINSIF